ncbi:MAG: hypothetical protein LBE20_01735 [Deltaproteobacteria bacterium]|jgi:hypothetical protein|nr:hypothetical protein [Deltaproteobacteria bacterium]
MLTVNLDGQNFPFEPLAVQNINELIELVKLNINSEKLISDINLQGQNISEVEYRAPLRIHRNSVLEINTVSREEFVNQRLELAQAYLEVIANKFQLVQPTYEELGQEQAAVCLADAINDLTYFFNWFYAILETDGQRFQNSKAEIDETVKKLTEICERVVEQQLADAWQDVCTLIDAELITSLIAFSEIAESV